MRVEQQSLSAELSLTQTERPRSHGHRAAVLLQAEDPALPAGCAAGWRIRQGILWHSSARLEPLSKQYFLISSNSSSFLRRGVREGENDKLCLTSLLIWKMFDDGGMLHCTIHALNRTFFFFKTSYRKLQCCAYNLSSGKARPGLPPVSWALSQFQHTLRGLCQGISPAHQPAHLWTPSSACTAHQAWQKKGTYPQGALVSRGCWWVTLVEVAAWVGWRTWPDGAGVGSAIWERSAR